MPAFWCVALDLWPLMGRAASGCVSWGVCGLNITLSSLSADCWVCVLVSLVIWRVAFSTEACRQLSGTGSWS